MGEGYTLDYLSERDFKSIKDLGDLFSDEKYHRPLENKNKDMHQVGTNLMIYLIRLRNDID